MKTLLIAAALGLCAAPIAFGAGSAAARPAEIVVQTNDLDLGNPDQRAELDRRIDSAAHRFCNIEVASNAWTYRDCLRGVRAEVEEKLRAGK